MASEVSSTIETPTPPTKANSYPSFDSHSLQITQHKLNGLNFREWFQSVILVIKGRGKIGYLTGAIPAPSTTEANYSTWEVENSFVMAWLINSMEPSIGRTYLFYQTAKEIWDAVQEIYSDLENTSQCFEIRSRIRNTKPGGLTVTEYYNSLVELWQEIDLFYDVGWACPFDAEKYKKLLEKERTFDFLHGLTPDLDEVRGRLLGVKPFPTLRESFAEVRREESRKRVMMTPSKPEMNPMEIQGSALISKQQDSKYSPQQTERIWCDYCQKPYHTRDTCWDLHGKPADWKPKKQRRPPRSAHLAESNLSTTAGLEEMLKQLLNHTKSSTETASSHSKPSTAAIAQTDFTKCNNTINVWVVDGKMSPAMGQGTVCLPHMILNSVMFVPQLQYNLLSVSKLTSDMNCTVIFFSSHCEFQDRSSGKMIGIAEKKNGLYYLSTVSPSIPSQHKRANSPDKGKAKHE